MRRALVVMFLGFLAAGCDGATLPSDPIPPTCTTSQLKVIGTVNGTSVTETVDSASYAFGNATLQDRGELVEPVQNPQQVLITFTQTVLNGQSVPAIGQVDFSATGGVKAGNCDTGTADSTFTMDPDGKGATFILRHLHSDPFCSAPEVTGSLAGCLRFSNG